MVNFKLVISNAIPTITYELVADLGKDGTKTIYECESLAVIYMIISEIRMGKLSRFNLNLTAAELENIETIGINIILTAKKLDIVEYEQQQSAMAKLRYYKVVKE